MSVMEHLTFSGLRSDHDREWFRLSDLLDASQAEGYRMTRWEVLKATAGLPKPTKKYGHAHYGPAHLYAVRTFAARRASKENA